MGETGRGGTISRVPSPKSVNGNATRFKKKAATTKRHRKNDLLPEKYNGGDKKARRFAREHSMH